MKNPHYYIMFALFFALSLATSPKEPIIQYNYSGKLVCDSLASLQNYTVTLFGKAEYEENYRILPGLQIDNEISISISDTTGYFYLSVNSYQRFDSLKLGIILPDKPVFFSKAYSFSENQYYEMTIARDSGEAGSGCSCVAQPEGFDTKIFIYAQSNIRFSLCGVKSP